MSQRKNEISRAAVAAATAVALAFCSDT